MQVLSRLEEWVEDLELLAVTLVSVMFDVRLIVSFPHLTNFALQYLQCVIVICNIERKLSFVALTGYERAIDVIVWHGVWPEGVGESCETA
jgi:hypothetical protein